jgi:hypothetical protein
MWHEEDAQPMTLVIDLQPDIERGLMARAQAKGVSLSDYAQEILSREAMPVETPPHVQERAAQAANLYDLFASVRGLLTDDEVDLYFRRTPSASRPVDFE